MMQDLKKIAIIKAISIDGVLLVAHSMLAWWSNNDIGLCDAILNPTALISELLCALSVFSILMHISRCPKCKTYWAFHKVEERDAPDGIGMIEEIRRNSPLSMPSVIVEYKCSACGHEKAIKRIKLITSGD